VRNPSELRVDQFLFNAHKVVLPALTEVFSSEFKIVDEGDKIESHPRGPMIAKYKRVVMKYGSAMNVTVDTRWEVGDPRKLKIICSDSVPTDQAVISIVTILLTAVIAVPLHVTGVIVFDRPNEKLEILAVGSILALLSGLVLFIQKRVKSTNSKYIPGEAAAKVSKAIENECDFHGAHFKRKDAKHRQ